MAEYPVWGLRKVWTCRRHLGIVVSRKRFWTRKHALGLAPPPVSEREQPLRRGHVVVPESNRHWATDLTITWTARDGTVARIPMIDCGNRMVSAVAPTKP